MKNLDLIEIENLAKNMRRSIIETGFIAGRNSAHFGGSLSAVEILACLYGGIMDIDSKNPTKIPRDIFIMSKGHGVLSLAVALAHTGFFDVEKLKTFELDESDLSGHVIMNLNLGMEFSSGSLGIGFSQAVGVALGYRKKKIDNKVFVLIGDGELDEGSNWEAAMSAAHFKLDNLLTIVDKNNFQLDDSTDKIMNLGDLNKKFLSFGFDVRECDGHDISAICKNITEMLDNKNNLPKVLIANTTKGKGISFMENKAEWHHGELNQKLYEQAIQELEAN